jgi:hypothetical protein
MNERMTREQWEFLEGIIENPHKTGTNIILLECYKDKDKNIKWSIKVMNGRNVDK